MGFNDSIDDEAVLETAPTPPALTPAGVPVPPPSGPPQPIQRQPAPRSASVQAVPVDPPSTQIIAPTTQTPLSVDGQDATPQTPATTTPGVLEQS